MTWCVSPALSAPLFFSTALTKGMWPSNICVEAKGQGYHFGMYGLLAYHRQPRRREKVARIRRVCTALSLLQVLLTVTAYSRVWSWFQSSHSQSVHAVHHLGLNGCLTTHDAFGVAVDKNVKPSSHHWEMAATSFPAIGFYQMSHYYL